MNAQVLPLPKPKQWEPVTDSKGVRLKGFLRHRKTGTIYYRETFKKLGIPPLFASTGSTTLGLARSSAKELVNRHKNKHLGIDDSKVYGRRQSGKLMREIAQEFLDLETPRRRRKTQINHRQYINEIIHEFGAYGIETITLRDFEAWIARLKRAAPKTHPMTGHKYTRTTFDECSKYMNVLFNYAYQQKYVSHLLEFSSPDAKRPSGGRVYSDDEISRLWAHMGENLRDQFVLSYECFMRLREVLHLTWDRASLETGLIKLRAEDVKTGSRTGRGREFIMSPHALERLQARWARRKPKNSPYVFPSREKPLLEPADSNKTAWVLAKANAKVSGKARWHDLRHSSLSKALLVLRLDPVAVSEYAGVSLQTIQRVYLHSRAEHTRDVSRALSVLGKV